MAQQESPSGFETEESGESEVHWTRGGLAGAIASLAMAAVIVATDLSVLRGTIAGLYLQEGVLAGLIVHVIHGALFGILFAVIIVDPPILDIEDSWVKSTAAGVIYGLVLGVFAAGMIMPIWLNVVDPSVTMPVPNVTVPVIAWHLVYGVILGAIYSFPGDHR